MKTVGLIGGLGPKTTSRFYLELISLCQKYNKDSRPPILIYSIPLPYSVERRSIVDGGEEEKCIPFLIDAAKRLEKAGADFIVMPCNSLHAFIKEIRNSVKIPILNILEEVIDFLKEKNISEVGLISTSITIKRNLYKEYLSSSNIGLFIPNKTQQSELGKIIHRLVLNKYIKSDRNKLLNIVSDFKKRGVKHVILACTDLQLLMPHKTDLRVYDTMKIFVEATFKAMSKIKGLSSSNSIK